MVELMVSLSIIGLLLAVVVAAVQRARATARNMQCLNNLKQLGIAAQACASTNGHFPANGYQAWADLWHALGNPQTKTFSVPLEHPSFLCPADGFSGGTEDNPGSRSYAMNAGTNFRRDDSERNGYALESKERHPADVSDGQSQTAMFSERLREGVRPPEESQPGYDPDPRRYLWWTEHEIPRTPGNEAAVARECETGRTSQWPSEYWGVDSPGHGYDHRLPPNRPACWNGDYLHAYTSDATVPASSNHGSSVNVLFIDGHASSISDGIDLGVWQAIGTINGGESVGEF